jgi:glycosyltransferase involved in cell wall biosynthesis
MRAAFVLTQDRGGPADLTVGLARELDALPGGPEVMVFGPPTLLRRTGLPPHLLRPVSIGSKLDGRGFAELSGELRDADPDLVHAQDHRASMVSCLVAGRRPVVTTFHGVPDSAAGRWVRSGPLSGRPAGLTGASRLAVHALVARRTACTIAPSAAVAAFLRQHMRVPARRVRLLPNGVRVPARSRQAGEVRTFATVTSFAPCKATPLLVQTFAELAAGDQQLRLLMVGTGADRRRCEQLAGQVPGQVEFTGFRTDVPDQLARADAFVLPSLNENLPLALMEAMAAGLPCIATEVGGVREVLGDCGLLIPPGDREALRDAMELLAADPDLAARLGQAGRQRVEDKFTLAECARQHLRLWTEIVSGEITPPARGSARG